MARDFPEQTTPAFDGMGGLPAETIYTLEILHATDQEAAAAAVFDAPRLSAVMNALEAQDLGNDGLRDNTLRLSSGDAILPGLFFQASAAVFGVEGVADMLIQNALDFDAIAFGNHEFDLGSGFIADLIDGTFDLDGDPATNETPLAYDVAGVPAYLGTIMPYLSSNLDFSTEPDLAPLEVEAGGTPRARTVTSSVVLVEGGELIGLVGATTPTLDFISSPGALGVLPTEFDGDPTPEQLDELAAIIQAEVDALLAANPTMNKVILQAHMQQIAIEQELAARLVNVDVIIAGGSNTRLLDETDRPRDGDSIQGDYPIIVESAGGTDTLIVNTDGSYKYVGRLVIDFDDAGNIIAGSYDAEVSGAFATDAQGVADLDAEALVDAEVQAVADAIGAQIALTESNVFGLTDVYLNGLRGGVRTQETNLGNLTADANLAAAKGIDAAVLVSIKNGGGIRNDIGEVIVPPGGSEPDFLPPEEVLDANGNVIKPAGGISQNDIANALSFNNGLSILSMTTAELAAVLEHGIGASTYDAVGGTNEEGRFPQIAGLRFSFDPDLPAGGRIQNAAIVGEDGTVIAEIVRDGAIVDNGGATFRVVTLGFLADGGDGYPFPTGAGTDRVDLVAEGVQTGAATFADDGTEQDALAEYLTETFLAAPFEEADTGLDLDGRIQNLNFRGDAVFDGSGGGDAAILLNEVLGSTTGTDSEYVEMIGEAGASLAGLSLVVIESDAGTSNGAIDFRYDFAAGATLGDNGFLLLANQTAEATYGVTADIVIGANSIENGAYTIAIVETASLAGGTVSGGEVVLDAVGVSDGGASDAFAFGAPVVGPDVTFLPAGVGRIEDGVDTDTAADWQVLNFDNGPPNDPTPGFSDGGEPEFVLISEIQGAGDASPLTGQRVTVQGIVTLVSNQLNGFFIQEEEADQDGDAATSEGVFVFTGSDPTVAVGDQLTLTGTVGEFFETTQLSNAEFTVDGAGAALPGAVEIALPLPDDAEPAEVFEAVEGMRVRVVAGEGERLTVTDTFTSFGEVGVTSGAPLVQPTQAHQSFTPEAEALAAANARDILLFENAEDDSLSSAPRVGDAITGDAIDGVMHFSFGEYKVETQGAVEFDASVNPGPRQDAPDDVGGSLKVASFNVLNYFTTLGSRGAETEEELEIQTAKIVAAIAAIDADILGLIEIENDLGAPDEATAALVDALNAEVGAGTYAFVATGAIGTDEIKQALIYKTATVAPTGDFAVLDTEAFTAPFTPGDPQSRPALAQTFTEIATGEVLTVSVNHLKSKGSPTGAVVNGEADDSDVEGSAALTRVAAATELAAWLASDPTGSGDADQLTIGDFNAYAGERAIAALTAAGLTNLAAPTDVSFQFGGALGTLDYAFANGSLAPQVTGSTIWNVNSPEASSIQYDGADFAEFGDLSAFASSDHDPVIVGLDLSSPELILGTARSDQLRGTEGRDIIVAGGGKNDVARGLGSEDVFVFTDRAGAFDRLSIRDYAAGEDLLDLGGAEIASVSERGQSLRIRLEGEDRDLIVLRGVDDISEVTFTDNALAWV